MIERTENAVLRCVNADILNELLQTVDSPETQFRALFRSDWFSDTQETSLPVGVSFESFHPGTVTLYSS